VCTFASSKRDRFLSFAALLGRFAIDFLCLFGVLIYIKNKTANWKNLYINNKF
jgi:hypothetical protein